MSRIAIIVGMLAMLAGGLWLAAIDLPVPSLPSSLRRYHPLVLFNCAGPAPARHFPRCSAHLAAQARLERWQAGVANTHHSPNALSTPSPLGFSIQAVKSITEASL